MTGETTNTQTTFQSISLVVLRTLIGWHFLYEAYYKLNLPDGKLAVDQSPPGRPRHI